MPIFLNFHIRQLSGDIPEYISTRDFLFVNDFNNLPNLEETSFKKNHIEILPFFLNHSLYPNLGFD